MGVGESNTNEPSASDNTDAVSVILHVYQPGADEQSPIGMVYHSGVEVFGSEYYYGGGNTNGTGVMVQKPKSQPRGSKWTYYNSYTMSKNIKKSRQQVRELIALLRNEWKAQDYHLSTNNCNHFSDAFVKVLCGDSVSIPSWVNRLARMGNMVMSTGLLSEENKKKLNNQMSGAAQQSNSLLQNNAEYASEYGAKHKQIPVIEYIPEAKTIFLVDHININECGALNLCEEQTSTDLGLLFTQNLNSDVVAIKSENDEQLLLFVPFKRKIKLEAIGLALPFGESCPKTIKLFSGKKNIDFDDAETMKATKTINIKQKKNEDQQFWTKSYPLKITKFNTNYLTIFIKDNYGDDISKLFKIELWGQD